jgi:PHD/YefM family antitoxin component YafN of YafNO toxin-antitoxin module
MKTGSRITVVLAVILMLMSFLAYAEDFNKELLNKALLEQASKGDVQRVKELIAQGAAVNARTKNDLTCLMKAAWNGHTETVTVLLAAGADVNAWNRNNRWTALKIASWGGHTEMVKALLAAGAYVNIDTGPNFSVTALGYAKKYGHTQIVELLKKAQSNPNNVQKLKKAKKDTKSDEFLILKVLWVLFWAVPIALIASYKNRSVFRWLLIGSIFGPFGLIVIAFPRITKPGEKPLSPGEKYIKQTALGYLISSFVALLGAAFLIYLHFTWFAEDEMPMFGYAGIAMSLFSLVSFLKLLKIRRMQQDEIADRTYEKGETIKP